jgi:hypothetical protein
VHGPDVGDAAAPSSGGKDPARRHRHDVGAVDHGPRSTEPITRGIQGVLGLAIAATLALVVYVVVLAVGA